MPFMRAPNCATGPGVPGTTKVATTNCKWSLCRRSTRRRRGRRASAVVHRIEMPTQKRPDPVPRVPLVGRALGLPRAGFDAAVEGMTAWRVVVDLGLRQQRLSRAKRVHQLHVLLGVHVRVVSGDVDEQRDLQLVDAVQGRTVFVNLAPL